MPLAFLFAGLSIEEKSKIVLDDLVERLPENFDLEDIRSRVDEYSPYVMVAIQVRPSVPLTGRYRLEGDRAMAVF